MKASRTAAEEQVLEALSHWSPQTFRDLAESLGMSPKATFARCDRMRERGLLHVVAWTKSTSGPPLPLLAIGRAADAPRPRPMTPVEKARKHRQRIKADAKRHAAALRKKRAAIKKRLAEDPEFALERRTYAREWSRKTYGHKPRTRKRIADPLLAALMRPLETHHA